MMWKAWFLKLPALACSSTSAECGGEVFDRTNRARLATWPISEVAKEAHSRSPRTRHPTGCLSVPGTPRN